MTIPKHWKRLDGDLYEIRAELKALGAVWDLMTDAWWVDPKNFFAAQDLVEAYQAKRRRQ